MNHLLFLQSTKYDEVKKITMWEVIFCLNFLALCPEFRKWLQRPALGRLMYIVYNIPSGMQLSKKKTTHTSMHRSLHSNTLFLLFGTDKQMRLHLVMMTHLSKLRHFPLPFSPKVSTNVSVVFRSTCW